MKSFSLILFFDMDSWAILHAVLGSRVRENDACSSSSSLLFVYCFDINSSLTLPYPNENSCDRIKNVTFRWDRLFALNGEFRVNSYYATKNETFTYLWPFRQWDSCISPSLLRISYTFLSYAKFIFNLDKKNQSSFWLSWKFICRWACHYTHYWPVRCNNRCPFGDRHSFTRLFFDRI